MPDTALDPETAEDAALLASIIRDNEKWNVRGITDKDIAIVFEMSPRCGWGESYTPARFKKALRAMTGVVRVHDRWFPTDSPNLRRVRSGGPRVCEGPKCSTDISHLRASTRFCSDRCRVDANRAKKRHGAVTPTLQTSRSEAPEKAQNRESGPNAFGPSKTTVSRNTEAA